MKKLTHLSLFSGIGGLDIAGEWAGFTTVGQCEWADYPTKVLEKHWPDVPRWKDIHTLTGSDFYARAGLRTVDIISGGFPCQPFSVAGKRRGKEDDRYLWPEMLRVISEIRPAWVLGENVPGIINLALDTVLSDLEGQGYACQTFIIPAAGVDAPHKRARIAIVGYSEHNGLSSTEISGSIAETSRNEPERQNTSGEFAGTGEPRNSFPMGARNNGNGWATGLVENTCRSGCSKSGILSQQPRRAEFERNGENVANPDYQGLQVTRPEPKFKPISAEDGVEFRDRRSTQPGLGSMVDGLPKWMGGYWPTEPEGIPRVATGISHRVDQLKGYGNAVVPQQFYPFFKWIAEIEQS